MKNFITTFCVLCFYSGVNFIEAQQITKTSPIYDRVEDLIINTDTIPDFRSKANKLKLTGTIYQSDGTTPAKDVILYIEQPNENGNFDLRRAGAKRYVFHRSWVKTDADGKYTIYTFIPGSDRRYNQLQQIFPVVKAPLKDDYEIETFLFDDDPLLSKICRKRIAKNSDTTRILKPKKVDGILLAQRDIVLRSDNEAEE